MGLFTDRAHAGRVLAASLEAWRGTGAVVCGIPRGGVVVAAEVARLLELTVTAVVVRKLGAPGHPEYALGAIAEGVRLVDERTLQDLGASAAELAAVEAAEGAELTRRRAVFAASPPALRGRVVIVVDDGIATGMTANAACAAVRTHAPATVVLAVPVAPRGWAPTAGTADLYVCPHRVSPFWAVGEFYDDFTQTTDEEVQRLLGT